MRTNKMKLKKEIETKACFLKVYDTGFIVDFYHIFAIKSIHKKTGKVLMRFGSASQVNQILNTYHLEKRFKL